MKPYLQYLVVLLDDTSMAYCHAENPLTERRLMPLDTLRKAILFGMKQNLMIQFVYPDYELLAEYNELIETIDHVKIGREVKISVTYNRASTIRRTLRVNTHGRIVKTAIFPYLSACTHP